MNYTLGPTLLKIENVDYTADGGFRILSGVNAEIRRIESDCGTHGCVVGFLGLSGSGKTTLFRLIAGLDHPTGGKITLNGFDRPVHPGEVGVVAQSYPLFDSQTVFANLILSAKKVDPKTANDRVMELVVDFGMEKFLHSYPAQLSGGQRQRVAIIQQLLCSEHFLLMDEPFSGLDIVMEGKTLQVIQKVASKQDMVIIVVTHDITAACAVADHLWVLGGVEYDAAGKRTRGSRIVKEFNLLDQGLCWNPDIIEQPVFLEFVRDVKTYFRKEL